MDFEISDAGYHIEVTVVMIKLYIVLQASGRNKAIYGFANRQTAAATVTINTCRFLKQVQSAHPENRIALQDISHANKIRLVSNSLQNLTIDQIGTPQ